MSPHTVDGACAPVNYKAPKKFRNGWIRTPGIVPLTIGGKFAVVPLSRGRHAIIDVADWPMVDGFNWSLHGPSRTGVYYAYRNVDDGVLLLHRHLMGNPDGLVDHWDGDGLNNRRSNLSVVTNSQNIAKARKRASKSGLRGVYYDRPKGKWAAEITVNCRKHHLGRFADKEDAARAYDAAARQHFGEFAVTNFPEVA